MEFWAHKWGEFFRTTDLHGYKYIALPGLTIYERVCWAIACVTCLITAVMLVVSTWSWYSYNPTVTVTESTHSPVWESPFPAVTVCDLNLVSRSAAHRLAHTWNLPPNMTAEDVFHDLKYVSRMKGTFFHGTDVVIDFSRLQDVLDDNNVTIHQLFEDLSTPCNRLIRRCSWKNSIYRCDLLFRTIITDEGYCCAFNYLATDPPEDWLRKSVFRTMIPQRVASCGAVSSLTFLLQSRTSDYYSTLYASTGVRIFVDNVYYNPDKNSPMRMVNPNTELFVAVVPDITYATAGVKSVDLAKRNCYFEHEQKLDNFNHYTYHNCLLECRAYITESKCGCIPFYLPNNGTFKVCDFRDLVCLENTRELYSSPSPHRPVLTSIRGTTTTPNPTTRRPAQTPGQANVPLKCRCVPNCEHQSYVTEMATGYLTRKRSITNTAFLKGLDLDNHSIVHVFYNDLVATKYRHDVYLNWQNLLASFGGLLSLLVGFTLIACFDFFYFFTLRLVFDVLRKKNRERSVQPEVDQIKDKPIVKKMHASIKVKDMGKDYIPAIDIIWEDLAPGGRWRTKPRDDDLYHISFDYRHL